MGRNRVVLLFLVLLACGALFVTGQTQKAPNEKAVVKYGVPVVAGPMDSILLNDYAPDSSLVVPRTEVGKARFPLPTFTRTPK
jgi:hypothetical protein